MQDCKIPEMWQKNKDHPRDCPSFGAKWHNDLMGHVLLTMISQKQNVFVNMYLQRLHNVALLKPLVLSLG